MSDKEYIKVEHVTKYFIHPNDKLHILNDVTFSIDKGEIVCIVGASGCGKSTLLRLISGLDPEHEGSIEIDGRNPYDREPSFLTDIYYLSDEPSPMNCTASSFAKNYGKFWTNFSFSDFSLIMSLFEMDEFQKMNQMSLGQLKKTYLAFALATHSKVILMDEPTNGLDIPSKALFRKAIMKYTSEDSIVIISTHQVRDLENIIDPIIVLDHNDVLMNASIAQITSKLFFDYGNEPVEGALYREMIPGGSIQVYPNTTGADSKVNIEALFNATQTHKALIKNMFINSEE